MYVKYSRQVITPVLFNLVNMNKQTQPSQFLQQTRKKNLNMKKRCKQISQEKRKKNLNMAKMVEVHFIAKKKEKT